MVRSFTTEVPMLACHLPLDKHHIKIKEDFVLLRTVSFLLLKLVVVAPVKRVSSEVKLRNFKGAVRQRLVDIYYVCFQSIWKYLGCPVRKRDYSVLMVKSRTVSVLRFGCISHLYLHYKLSFGGL